MGAYSAELSGITQRLVAARGRVRLNLLFGVLAAAVGAAGIGFLIAFAAPRLWPEIALPTTWAFGIFTALVVGALTMIFGWLAIVLRAPGLPALARAADTHFGVKERFSTALEFDGKPAPSASPVVEALIRDAARHAEIIDARALVAWRVPRLLWGLPAIAALIAASVYFLPAPGGSVQAIEAEAAAEIVPLSAEEIDQLSVDIVRVAEIIEEQAAAHDDPLLAAVAQTLRSLGEDVASGNTTSRGDIMAQLSALSDYAAEATRNMAGNAQRIPELLDALAQTIEPPSAEGEEAGGGRDEFGAAASAAQVPPEQMGATGYEEERFNVPDPNRRSADISAAVDDIIQTFETPLETVGGLRPDSPTRPIPADLQDRPTNPDEENVTPAVGEMIGASNDANAGFSLLAGQGTEPLAGDSLMETRLQFETDAQLVLDGLDNGAGQRVSMDIAPPTRFTEPANASGQLPSTGWRALPPSGIVHPFISVLDSNVVRNYFGPPGQPAVPAAPIRPEPVRPVE